MKNTDLGILILRLSAGGMMLFHGAAKLLHGVAGMGQMLQSKGIPGFLAYGVFIGEILAPLMLIIGFRTRIAAILLLINMLVAIVAVHSGDLFSVDPKTGGWMPELAAWYLFTALVLLCTGGGKYALSHRNKFD